MRPVRVNAGRVGIDHQRMWNSCLTSNMFVQQDSDEGYELVGTLSRRKSSLWNLCLASLLSHLVVILLTKLKNSCIGASLKPARQDELCNRMI